MKKTTVYKAAVYVRLSKEDGDKAVSDSIQNQKELVRSYLEAQGNIEIAAYYVDDGYSGTNFSRPGFQAMLDEIEGGGLNCVAVKDLSRFGRNYIDTGEYVQILFPQMGVRFISVNDGYDSLSENGYSDHILLSFKNIMNDSYSGDLSKKIQSQLDLKRTQGQFIGSFAPFGYKKSGEDKNRLCVDEDAAPLIEMIFIMRLMGWTKQEIACRLNERGAPTPYGYKLSRRLCYETPFRKKDTLKWSSQMVGRILNNPVYAGTLVQGKKRKESYRSPKSKIMAKQHWFVTDNSHEGIVGKEVFDLVKNVEGMDCRQGGANRINPVTGLIICGLCKENMVLKNTGGYAYYVCSTHKKDKNRCRYFSVPVSQVDRMLATLLTLFAGNLPKEGQDIGRLITLWLIDSIEIYPGGVMEVHMKFEDVFEGGRHGPQEQEED